MRPSPQQVPRGSLLGLPTPKNFNPRGLAKLGESLEKVAKSLEEVEEVCGRSREGLDL